MADLHAHQTAERAFRGAAVHVAVHRRHNPAIQRTADHADRRSGHLQNLYANDDGHEHFPRHADSGR